MIDQIRQRIKLEWYRDDELEYSMPETEQAISSTSGSFLFSIVEYERRRTGIKFAILIRTTTGSSSGILHQEFRTLDDAINGLELWIQRTIFELGSAIHSD